MCGCQAGYLPDCLPVLCWSTLHLGKQGQMPPAFLVLHAPLSATLIVQGDMLDAAPAGLPAACWATSPPTLCMFITLEVIDPLHDLF